jgi:hypothetical protein
MMPAPHRHHEPRSTAAGLAVYVEAALAGGTIEATVLVWAESSTSQAILRGRNRRPI